MSLLIQSGTVDTWSGYTRAFQFSYVSASGVNMAIASVLYSRQIHANDAYCVDRCKIKCVSSALRNASACTFDDENADFTVDGGGVGSTNRNISKQSMTTSVAEMVSACLMSPLYTSNNT